MPDFLVKYHTPDADGRILHTTPESAGWRYVGFELHELWPIKAVTGHTEDREVLLDFVGGTGSEANTFQAKAVCERPTLSEDALCSVYLPPQSGFRATASTQLELVVYSAPAHGKYPPRLIMATNVSKVTRGTGTNTRYVHDILAETAEAEALLVVESVTPDSHWSSCPPHKHDIDDLPWESFLGKTYYHCLKPKRLCLSAGKY